VLVTDGVSQFSIANPDFTRLSFRSTLVLRWEWRPGSTFYLIWQQNRAGATAIGGPVTVASLWDATTASGDNFLAIKINYWISVR